MESAKNMNTPAMMLCPAFRVENGAVCCVNDAAAAYGITVGTQIENMIHIGNAEFSEFTDGRLDLTLMIGNVPTSACVIADEHGFTFCLDSDFARPEQRALALAAQHLREPLSNAISSTSNMLANSGSDKNIHLMRVQKNLQQIMRMLCNMSDLATYENSGNFTGKDIVALFREILDKAQTLLEKAGKKLVYTLPSQRIFCAVDEKMLERAVLNLLSNSVIFLEGSDTVKADLLCKNDRIYFSVENSCNTEFELSRDLFARYMREPSIEEGRSGIGLGLPIVHAVAAAHNGTVLMRQPEKGVFCVTMTLSAQSRTNTTLRSPILIPYDYSGGWDNALMELSGILPADLYED